MNQENTEKINNAQKIMTDFVRLGAIVDVMFLFNAYLTAEHISEEHVKSVLDGYKESIMEKAPDQYNIFVSGCDSFEKAVNKYREAIKDANDKRTEDSSSKID